MDNKNEYDDLDEEYKEEEFDELITIDGKYNKKKIIAYIFVVTISSIITAVVLFSIYMILKPNLAKKSSLITGSSLNENTTDNSQYIKAIDEAITMVNKKYIDIYDIDKEEMLDNILSGVAASVGDPYTRYITDEEFEEMQTSGTEEYTGIGVHLTFDTSVNAIIILGVMPGSPALEADLKVGDYILKVEETNVTLESYQDCIDIMKGKEGTKVKLVISRDGNVIEKEVMRRKIQVNNVESEVLEGNIGYIKILQFENDIAEQFKNEYDKLQKQNISGLIIDVRNNPGGLVTETIKMLDYLLPPGDVLKLVYKDGSQKVYKCTTDEQIKMPLAVLVNGSSASASEIFASAIKDAQKGKVIGVKTFGKGIVQEVEKLKTRGALSITVAKYYTNSGVEINKNGIEPDIKVEIPKELTKKSVLEKDEDTQLKEAIKYIKENI